MGFMDFIKNKKVKGESIVEAFKNKYQTIVNDRKVVKCLKQGAKVAGLTGLVVLVPASLASCGSVECLYCNEHHHNHTNDSSYVETSQNEPYYGEGDIYIDPELGWEVGGNHNVSSDNNGITSEPHDYENSFDIDQDIEQDVDTDINIEDNDNINQEDNLVGGNGAVVEGNDNETIIVNGDIYYIYNEYNQVINVGDINNPNGLTQEQFDKLMEILSQMNKDDKDETSKDETSDETSKDESQDPEIEEPEDKPGNDSNVGGNQGNQGNENVGGNGNQGETTEMTEADKFVSNSAWGVGKNVQVLRMYTQDLTMYDGIYPLSKAVDVYFDLSDGTTIAIPFDINVFNMINGGKGFVVERENLGHPSIAHSLSDMTYLYTHGQLPQEPAL